MAVVRVSDAGLFTTVQDLGRPGYGAGGVPPSGAADALSLVIGNRLLGNPDAGAALECTLLGPTLSFEFDGWVCLTGATYPEARVSNGDGERRVRGYEPTPVQSGSRLIVGGMADGARAYVCVAGGVSVPPVLGSRSTLAGASLGGFDGRPLRSGDALPLGEPASEPRSAPAELLDQLRSELKRATLRVVPSLHSDRFPTNAMEAFASTTFTVGARSDRVGVRLEGAQVPVPADADRFDSEPTVTGGIQVTADGQPIVLGVDRPTTGGYPLLACVIGADLPAFAMLRPADTVRFEPVTMDEARRATATQRRMLNDLLPAVTPGAKP